MPDIRMTPQVDDFCRPGGVDESPILFPWTRTWVGPDNLFDMELEADTPGGQGTIGSTSFDPNDPAWCQWTPDHPTHSEGMSGPCEGWGQFFANANLHDSYQFGLLTQGAPTGYQFYSGNSVGDPDGWSLHKYSAGDISTLATAPSQPLPAGPQWFLMRLTNTNVQCWHASPGSYAATPTSWSLIIDAADADYRSHLCITPGARGGAPGWRAVGGGVLNRTQIYRYVSN